MLLTIRLWAGLLFGGFVLLLMGHFMAAVCSGISAVLMFGISLHFFVKSFDYKKEEGAA